MTNIFNLSFSTGVFTSELKIARVVSIHKKQPKLKLSNYRLVSLLSNLDKILEKLSWYITEKEASNSLDFSTYIFTSLDRPNGPHSLESAKTTRNEGK